MSKFIVDSNFFIQAHRAIYPLDVVQSFWLKLKNLADSGIIISIDKVKLEIFHDSAHEDELKDWCEKNLSDEFFHKTDVVIENYIKIVNWAASSAYTNRARQEFLETDLADPWLVAYAMKTGYTIVTYEKSEPNSKRKIKIPEVCREFKVRYLNTIEMLRELNESF
ncbi:MAG: DUF4411 family protein [Cyclobacteriaceae bacterium]|nr:DUF4411 family protein [Cyclobacteriaceae bacterium]MCH8515816.1 DUF4411 family protein [Cyclobacteriaceae bacterium]